MVCISVLLATFSSCKKEVIDNEPIAEEEETVEISDPFYAELTETSTLDDYWAIFVADAIRSGKPDPGTGRVISVFFVQNLILLLGLLQIMPVEPITSVMRIL
ncbi:hypothetical protein OAU12_01925 [Flavobacteriaceae bacterium]|nr:hypothetical protein [Flavobacteriaceae bacterium]